MAKVTLNDIDSLANVASAKEALNDNFTALETAVDNSLSRVGGTPNAMEVEIDMGEHKILNVADPVAELDAVNLRSVRPLVDQFAGEIAEVLIEGTLRVKPFVSTAGQTDFVLDDSPGVPENVQVYDQGIWMEPGVDYTLGGTDLKTISFFTGRALGNRVVARYTQLAPSDSQLRADLANAADAAKGPAIVNWLASGAGAILRTLKERISDLPVSVLDFIPKSQHAAIAAGTSTFDATTYIQAAITAAAGKILEFPKGTYVITAELTVTATGTIIRGASRQHTIIRQDTLSARIFNVSGQRTVVRDLGFSYGTGTPTGTAILSTGHFSNYDNIVILRCGIGIIFTTGAGQRIRDFEILEYENIGIHCTAVNDVWISKGLLNAGNGTRGLLGGLRLSEKAEAIFVTDIDILVGKYSITTAAASYTAGARPAYCTFTNMLCDSSDQGSVIDHIVESEFIGCWFSGGRSGPGYPGLFVQETASLKFTNTRFFNNGTHGCYVESTAIRTKFVNCSATSNSFTAGVGVAHGWNFHNTQDFSLVSCVASNGLAAGAQGYGIFVDATSNNFSIKSCTLSGNATSSILDATSDTTAVKSISGNVGYVSQSKGTSSVAVGQTVATVTHGLSDTPLLQDIIVMPTTLGNLVGITDWRITTVTSTTFQVQTNTAVTTNPFTFAWKVRIKGD